MSAKILCQMHTSGFTVKPTDNVFMGQLRDKMITRKWDYVSELVFLHKVTEHGVPFYGCVFNGHDLLEYTEGRQRQCWRAQSIVAVDIDKCPIHPQDMAKFYMDLGYLPWAVYTTFSNGTNGLYSYRLMWNVEVDHNVSYEQWGEVIRGLSGLTEYGDKRARDCSRMWQGSRDGLAWHVRGLKWTYAELASKLGIKS